MQTRGEPGDELDIGDCYFVFDNTAHHQLPKVLQCFTTSTGNAMEKESKTVYISYDADSLRERKGVARAETSFDVVEHMVLVTKKGHEITASLPHAKRLRYAGSNVGNMIGPVKAPPYDVLWQLPCKIKREIVGAYRIPCGGPTPDEQIGRGTQRKSLNTIEPVFWRSRPEKLYQTLLADYHITAVIDLTAGDGVLMTHCVKARLPYCGFALSEAHSKILKAVVTSKILEKMFQPGERGLYDPALANLLQPQAKGNDSKKTETDNDKGSDTKGEKRKISEAAEETNVLKEFEQRLADAKKKKGQTSGNDTKTKKNETADKDSEE